MAKTIKERISILSELNDVVETLDNSIEMYEKWANEQGTDEETAKNYLSVAMIKTKVRDMIIKLADSV